MLWKRDLISARIFWHIFLRCFFKNCKNLRVQITVAWAVIDIFLPVREFLEGWKFKKYSKSNLKFKIVKIKYLWFAILLSTTLSVILLPSKSGSFWKLGCSKNIQKVVWRLKSYKFNIFDLQYYRQPCPLFPFLSTPQHPQISLFNILTEVGQCLSNW